MEQNSFKEELSTEPQELDQDETVDVPVPFKSQLELSPGQLRAAQHNLTPWQPGQAGGGHKVTRKRRTTATIINRIMNSKCPDTLVADIKAMFPKLRQVTLQEAVILRLYVMAINGKGNVLAAKEILDRVLGKSKESLKLELDNTNMAQVPIIQVINGDAAVLVQNLIAGAIPVIKKETTNGQE
jgi:hypothetical protein